MTAKQYTDFLNNKAKCDSDPYGLYNTAMAGTSGCGIQRSGGGILADPYSYTVDPQWANRPVNHVSYWDACRFANWLGNSQGNGDTETGAYTLTTSGIGNNTITRNAGWKWAVTSEDEWYKAAYYDPNKAGGAGYWDYPMQSDVPTLPGNDITDPDGGNNANFYQNHSTIGLPYNRTVVGEFENSESAYGTFDQGGNVWEWNETIQSGVYRDMRGGTFCEKGFNLQASWRDAANYPSYEHDHIGFRVSEVPEPSSIIALVGGLVSLLGIKRNSK